MKSPVLRVIKPLKYRTLIPSRLILYQFKGILRSSAKWWRLTRRRLVRKKITVYQTWLGSLISLVSKLMFRLGRWMLMVIALKVKQDRIQDSSVVKWQFLTILSLFSPTKRRHPTARKWFRRSSNKLHKILLTCVPLYLLTYTSPTTGMFATYESLIQLDLIRKCRLRLLLSLRY